MKIGSRKGAKNAKKSGGGLGEKWVLQRCTCVRWGSAGRFGDLKIGLKSKVSPPEGGTTNEKMKRLRRGQISQPLRYSRRRNFSASGALVNFMFAASHSSF